MQRSIKATTVFLFVLFIAAIFLQPSRVQAQTLSDTAGYARRDTARHAVVVTDTPVVNQDSLMFALRPHPFAPDPKKAGLYSSILPGLGQLYNREYWKIPVVYVGIGVAAYFISKNLNQYQSYRLAYIARINNPNYVDQYTNIYNTAQLQQLQSDYSKYLDLTILFTSVGYIVQILDAVTAAHLKNFDISRDISLRMRPVVTPCGVGLGLVMNYK